MADLFSEGKVLLAGFGNVFLSIIMCCCVLSSDEGTPLVDLDAVQVEGFPAITEFAVMDTSGVLSRDSHNYFNQGSRRLQQANGGEIFVAVVPGISGSMNDAATQLFNGLGLGSKDLNNGALLLFTTDEPHVVLRTGSGLESCINDAKAGRILDRYAVPDMKQRRWNTAARNTWNAVARDIYSCYGGYGGKIPSAVMNEKGRFPENGVKTYDNPQEIKAAPAFCSGRALILTFALLAFGGMFLLAGFMALCPGTVISGGRRRSGSRFGGGSFHSRSGGFRSSGRSHGGGRSRGGGASR